MDSFKVRKRQAKKERDPKMQESIDDLKTWELIETEQVTPGAKGFLISSYISDYTICVTERSPIVV